MNSTVLPPELSSLTPHLSGDEALAWQTLDGTPPATPGWKVWQQAERQIFAYWPGEPEAVAHLQFKGNHFILYALWEDPDETPPGVPAPSAARSLALIKISPEEATQVTRLLTGTPEIREGSETERNEWTGRHAAIWRILAPKQTRILRHLQWEGTHLFWDERFKQADQSALAREFRRHIHV